MELFTFAQLKPMVNKQLDTEDENWIDDELLVYHLNEAIRKAEAFIHTLNWGKRHYFLVPKYALTLTNGSPYVPLPSDIYANKIRAIYWDNGSSDRYEVRPSRSPYSHHQDNEGQRYTYEIVNTLAARTQLMLSPAANETTSLKMYLWYLRQARRLTVTPSDADPVVDAALKAANVLDIPQATNFVIAHARMMTLAKPGEGMWKFYEEQKNEEWKLLVEALEQMTVDENTLIEPDMSYYADMVGWCGE